MQSYIRYMLCKDSPSFYGLSFHSFISIFWKAESFSGDQFQFTNFSFNRVCFGNRSKNSLLSPKNFVFCLEDLEDFMFSFRSFIILGFTFSCVIHFELIFIYGMSYGSNIFFTYVAIKLFQHQLLKITTLSPLNSICSFLKNFLYTCRLISNSVLFHWPMCLLYVDATLFWLLHL